MLLEDIVQLPFGKMVDTLCSGDKERRIDQYRKEYDGEHRILTDPDRRSREVGPDDNRHTVDPAKLVVPFQKLIVEMAVAFLFAIEPKLSIRKYSLMGEDGASEDAIDMAMQNILDVYRANKMEYFNRRLMREVCIETKAAELWWADPGRDNDGNRVVKVKCMLLSASEGSEIHAHWNDLGDMDAFVRQYTTTELIDGREKAVNHSDVYTADKIWYGKKISSEWEIIEQKNPFGKIPVIYYEQPEPEWASVQKLIDRMEYMISRHADSNDYNGHPITVAKIPKEGGINLPSKSEDGKFLQLFGVRNQDGKYEYGDINYLTWDQAPDSIKIEYDNIKQLIFSMTSTPDISFEAMKGIGTVSGTALRLMFLASTLKAKNKEEIYGEGLTRRNNLLKAIMAQADTGNAAAYNALDIDVEFQSPIPEDIRETITALNIARGGDAVVSMETAVRRNPLVDDADAEIERLDAEKREQASSRMIGSFGFGGDEEGAA